MNWVDLICVCIILGPVIFWNAWDVYNLVSEVNQLKERIKDLEEEEERPSQ